MIRWGSSLIYDLFVMREKENMKITKEIKNKAIEIIDKYNQDTESKYVPRFQVSKGFLFLDRIDNENQSKICRLKYNGKMNNWDFAIYKYSSDGYSTDEPFFPGIMCVDGTIGGAMEAGDEAYNM